MPDFLSVFEFAAKTVRHISREFRVAWVSGVEAAQRDAAEVLCEKEAEEDVAEGKPYIGEDYTTHLMPMHRKSRWIGYGGTGWTADPNGDGWIGCLPDDPEPIFLDPRDDTSAYGPFTKVPQGSPDMPPQSADFNDEPVVGEFCFGYNEYQPLPTPSEGCVCGHTQYVHVVGGCNAAYHYAVDPCVCKGFRLYSMTPAASAVVESDPVEARPPAASTGVLPKTGHNEQCVCHWCAMRRLLEPSPVASTADSIRDVLAEHYLESLSDRRIVGCRCGLELGSRRQHWDHQADLIAGALKARTQAQK